MYAKRKITAFYLIAGIAENFNGAGDLACQPKAVNKTGNTGNDDDDNGIIGYFFRIADQVLGLNDADNTPVCNFDGIGYNGTVQMKDFSLQTIAGRGGGGCPEAEDTV